MMTGRKAKASASILNRARDSDREDEHRCINSDRRLSILADGGSLREGDREFLELEFVPRQPFAQPRD